MIEIAIPIDVFLISLIALLIALVIASISSKLRPLKNRIQKRLKSIKRRKPKPASPHECAFCCQQTTLNTTPKRNVAPYSNRKSTRGVEKRVSTHGFACPNNQCHYFGITDQNIHALVAYGKHNHIPRFKCQACRKVFSSRHGTPLYQLKSDPQTIAFVLGFWLKAVTFPLWFALLDTHTLPSPCGFSAWDNMPNIGTTSSSKSQFICHSNG
jgi:hypothetical protein